MADIDTDVKPVSAVFIDVPNITRGRNSRWQHAFKWERLSQAISAAHILQGTELQLAAAYVSSWSDGQALEPWTRNAFKTFGHTSFKMRVRTFNDVDSLIIGDMWQIVAQRQQMLFRSGRTGVPIRVRFILISGDGDYAQTYDRLRETYGVSLELELIVFSWPNTTSHLLIERAKKVTSLRDVRGFLRCQHP